MNITAVVENGSIKLPPDVHVPDGTQARITFEPVAVQTLAERYAALIGFTDALPEDLAVNHDHYLHGKAKNERLSLRTHSSIWRCSTAVTRNIAGHDRSWKASPAELSRRNGC